MQPNALQDSTTQLTYSLTTEPMPVQVSLSTTSISLATLIFVVSCPVSVGSVTVSKITISLPVDTTGQPADPTNLCMTAPPLSSASISSSGPDQWVPSAGADPGTFIFTPKGGPVAVSTQSLTIEFTGIQVNTLVGTALITITEFYSSTSAGTQNVAVAKFPYGFYAGNFTSNKPMVQNGEKPVLSWSGSSNATYLMLYESNAPVNVSNVRTWSPPNGLTQMTTFILQVSAQQAGQTATMDFSITIEVASPSLTAQDLTVLKTSTLKGAVTVGASGAPANLNVIGDVQAGNNLISGGPFSAKTDASVSGKLSVGLDTTIGKTLNVAGATTLSSDLSVTGNTTTGAQLTAGNTWIKGPVSLFGMPQKCNPGTYSAQSDGFVVGVIFPPSQYGGPYYFSGTITGNSGGIVVYATGGGWISGLNPPNYVSIPLTGSFILPVKKGNLWTVGLVQPWTSNPAAPPSSCYVFYFVPLGTTSTALGGTMDTAELMKLIPTPPPTAPMMVEMGSEILMPAKKKRASKKKPIKKKTAAKKPATKKKAAAKKPAARKKTRKR